MRKTTEIAALAQLVEHVICNLGVVGPNPTGSSIKGSWHSGTAGDCKSLGQPDGVRFPDFPSQTSKTFLARFFFIYAIFFAFADENQGVKV